MRLVEQIKLSGFRRFFRTSITATGGWSVRVANGEAVVELDEEGLRHMIHQAIVSRGHKCKSGPLHVRFLGVTEVRAPLEDELEAAWPIQGGDDVFAGHVWTSRPR